MLLEEAKVIKAWLSQVANRQGDVCLNIGSSTEHFRRKVQPFIHDEVIAPLERAGWNVVHCDLKAEEGVDRAGDLADATFRESLRQLNPKLVLCSNLLEHVNDPKKMAQAFSDILSEGGHLLITVPKSYPYHPDPLDTYFRPSTAELAALLPHLEIVRQQEIKCGGLLREAIESKRGIGSIARMIARSMMPFYKHSQWISAAHPLLWLVRPFKVSAVLLRRP